MRTLRKVFFYFFLLVYLALAPTAILYALGYIVAPGKEKGLVRSGLLAIETTPADAQVFLGNSRYTRRTPTVIRDLVPGHYALRLAQLDAESLQIQLEISADRATVLDRIILLPANRMAHPVDNRQWNSLHAEPGEKRIVLEGGSTLAHWAVLNANDGTIRALLPDDSVWTNAVVLQSWFQPDSPRALIRATDAGQERYLWTALDDKTEDPTDVTPLFPELPDRVLWSPRDHNRIYAVVGPHINQLDIKEKAISPDYAPPATGIAVSRNRLFILNSSNQIVRIARAGEMESSDYRIPAALAEQLPSQRYALHLLPDDLALLQGEDGSLRINRAPWLLMERGALSLHPDEATDQILIVAGDKLGLLPLTADDKSKTLHVQWIHEHDGAIEQVEWIHDDTHILFSSLGQLWLLALERGGEGPARLLGPMAKQAPFVFSEQSGALYALDSRHRLARMNILPPRSFLPSAHPPEEDE